LRKDADHGNLRILPPCHRPGVQRDTLQCLIHDAGYAEFAPDHSCEYFKAAEWACQKCFSNPRERDHDLCEKCLEESNMLETWEAYLELEIEQGV
jgi:hypothetical protein